MAYKNIETVVNKIKYKYKLAILKQLKFNMQNRGRYRFCNYLSKYINHDEYITITDYKYNLIICRKCHTLKKSYLTHRLRCVDCCHKLIPS